MTLSNIGHSLIKGACKLQEFYVWIYEDDNVYHKS